MNHLVSNNNFDYKLNLLSLFSGGGFLDAGFLNKSYSIHQAVEINPFFIKSYNFALDFYLKDCFPNTQNKPSFNPIQSPLDASLSSVQRELTKTNKDINGIIGGPPCQDYSVMGNNAGMSGERGKLIYSYFEIVKSLKPEFIFFENVPGLYNTKIHQVAFLDLVKRLEDIGYVVWFDILNSLQYGIPQDRPRLTMVGFRKDIVKRLVKAGFKLKISDTVDKGDLVFKWPDKIIENPRDIKWPSKWKFGSDIISDDISDIPLNYQPLLVINAFKNISNVSNHNECFEPKSNRFLLIDEGDTNRKSFKRLHRFRFSPTVAYGNNEVHLHPTEPRRISVREALRLQSVPDNYVLPKEIPLTHKFKLISNGVPVRKASLIAEEIKRTLYNFYSL